MASSFESFGNEGEDDDSFMGYGGYNPHSQPYESSNFPISDDYAADDDRPNLTIDTNFGGENQHSPPVYGFGISTPDPSHVTTPFETEPAGNCYSAPAAVDDGFFSSGGGGGPLLPDPMQMQEEGFARREWRRQNAIHLEEKEKREKELRNQIMQEAEDFKQAFYEKRKLNCETNKANNREREKINLANQEKFHKEADKHYWKAIAEMIPREVPNIEKRRGKKEADNKPSVHVIQGPKPGKPTELARMRQMILKLKQNPPRHMMPPPPKEDKDAKEGKDGKDSKDAKEGKDDKSGKRSTPTAVEGGGGNKPASPAKEGAAESKPASPAKEGGANGAPEALAVVEGEQAPISEPSADQ
ncbi:hypothetical protein TanjilG_06540 [Lupinus angustifolius]|uniref:Clathrin light chain n=1 Tax=Lupinus angustifolius TaxID=3871 RepID=A0A1J7GFP0_LUPAN|nr:PREDICTED: clathrin light chain 1-like [Lupinus angustifolius]OIV99235.1 hypothetical protein TanjilG_06540 [Lupinus angustifolius]